MRSIIILLAITALATLIKRTKDMENKEFYSEIKNIKLFSVSPPFLTFLILFFVFLVLPSACNSYIRESIKKETGFYPGTNEMREYKKNKQLINQSIGPDSPPNGVESGR